MKKIIIGLLTISMVCTILINAHVTNAEDFEGNEEKYITLCASSTLTNTQIETCKKFNKYLKNKNNDLKEDISESQQAIADSKNNLASIETEITKIKNDIATKQAEINYLNTSITNLEDSIFQKEEEVKKRMYVMQSYTNNNSYVDFIFGAASFTDMFARIDSINEITSFDKDLVKQLADSKAELEEQRKTVDIAKNNLLAQEANQETLQAQYLAIYQQQNAALVEQQKLKMLNNNASEEIDDNLAALAAAAEQSRIDSIQSVIIDNPPSNNIGQSGGDSAVGVSIANYALSKQGSPYVWGAAGPNSFDCSGLVYWACKQAGVNFTRTTAAVLSTMGTSVSYANLQPGDIITFKTIPTYVSHVGIYIGGGRMVHAPTFDQPVQVANLNTAYWQNVMYNCRRLY